MIDIVADDCGGTGIDVINNFTTGPFTATCDHCTSSRNSFGVTALGNTGAVTLRMDNCKVTDNAVGGVEAAGLGVAASMGNNMIEGNNGNDVVGTITPLTRY